MKKSILVAGTLSLLALGFGVYYLLFNLDSIVESAIESHGSEAARTGVRVGGVKIDLREGASSVRGLTVANPPGFEAPLAFSLGEAAVKVDLDSVTEDVLVVDLIKVKDLKVFVEINADGEINLNALEKNLGASSRESAPEESSGSSTALIVRKVVFTGGKIHARVEPLKKDYELKLPTIKMSNVGGKNGTSPTRIANKILKLLTRRSLQQIKKEGIDRYQRKLEGAAREGLEAGKQAAESEARDRLKGALKLP